MAVGVGDGAVQEDEKVTDQLSGFFLILNEGFQQFVHRSQIYRKVGDRGDMLVEDFQDSDSLPQVGRGVQSQEPAALPHQLFIVGQNVAGGVGAIAFAHGTQDASFPQLPEPRGGIEKFHIVQRNRR